MQMIPEETPMLEMFILYVTMVHIMSFRHVQGLSDSLTHTVHTNSVLSRYKTHRKEHSNNTFQLHYVAAYYTSQTI